MPGKIVQVDGQTVEIVRVRGNGDGGGKIAYLVDMGDGTYADKIVWWKPSEIADEVYEKQSAEYLSWATQSALNRLKRPARKGESFDPTVHRDPAAETRQPAPTPEIRLADASPEAAAAIAAVIARRRAG
jgi:hypothetical protein